MYRPKIKWQLRRKFGDYYISTVCLHFFDPFHIVTPTMYKIMEKSFKHIGGKYETMIFKNGKEIYMKRYHSKIKARRHHNKIVEFVKDFGEFNPHMFDVVQSIQNDLKGDINKQKR